jgi:RHS repeat-associated protein
MLNNGRWELCVTESLNAPYGQNYGRIQVYTLSNTLVSTFEFNSGSEFCLSGGLPTVGYGAGNQPMVVGQSYRMKLSAVNASATFTIEYDNQQTDEICGGLRIKQTKIHDGISAANDITQNYRYEDKNNPAITSGILYLSPKYGYQLNSRTAVFTAYSMAPLSGFNGNHIGYKRVVLDKNGLGEEEIVYEVENDLPSNSTFPNKPPQYRILEGIPKEAKAFAENSTVSISQSTTQRNSSDYYATYGNSTASGYIYAYRSMPVSETGGNPVPKHFSTPYTFRTSIYRPATVSTTIDGISSSTAYTYHPNNLLPREVSTQDSNGDTYKTVNTYSAEHTNTTIKGKFLAYNMVHLPVTSLQYYNNVLVDGGQTDYRFYTSTGLSPSTSTSGRLDVPRPYQQKRFERSWTVSGTATGSTTTPVTKITFLEYNNDGLLALYEKIGWNTTRISYANKLPTQKQYRNHTETYQYFTGSSLLQSTVAVDGTSTSYTYDALGRLQTATDGCLNIVTTYTYHFTTGGTDKNYTEVKTDFPSPSANSQLDILFNRTYLDGLGRGIQSVARNQGPASNQDIISAQEYDKFGRVKRAYESFAQLNNNGNFLVPNVSWGYTETTFETSPLSRPLTVTPPSWAPSTLTYGTNSSADKVKIAAGSINYGAGALSKQTVKDGNNNLLIVFTDKLGRKVLSRRAAASGAEASWLDTYYLYDGKNRLSKVVPPGATLSTPNLLFTYLYDGQDQLLEKKVPDRAKEQFSYNAKNLLAARKDGYLTSLNRWYVYKYDDYGRETNAGFLNGSLPGDLTNLNPSESLFQTTYGTNLYDRDKATLVRTKIMDGGNNFLSTYNTFNSCGILTQQQGNNHLQTLPDNGETTTYAYDGAQNIIQSVYTHKALAQTHTITSTHFIDYAGRSLSNDFKVNSGPTRKLNQFTYDHKDNVLTKHQGGTGLSGTLAFLQKIDYSYLPNGILQGINLNAAGKLSGSQTYLPTNGASAAVPTPAIPSSSNYDDKDLFQLELYRNAQATGIPTATFPARNNGDIVAVSSQVRGRSQQVWAVAYDSYDRMTNTAFYQRASRTSTPSLYNNYRESLTYDQRGNIKTLHRDGSEQTGANYSKRDFDRLTYIYDNEANNNISNRLLDVNENTGGSTTLGYKPGVPNYTYDTNGNLRTDPSKGITVTWNHQDLPLSIVWANGQRLNMIYDAAGTLLRREQRSSTNALVETTDFVGGIEYKQMGTGAKNLALVHHAEGRIVFTGTAQEWQYALTDHLGNTRLLYADRHGATTVLPADGIISVPSEIVQEEHYYPFGMKLTGPWMGGAAGAKSAYQYNGIEHVDAFELNVNMAMYRTLDPVVGRWWSVDPKAELMIGWSPYNSMGNSPMVHTDPNGDVLPAIAIAAIIGGVIGGAANTVAHWDDITAGGGFDLGKAASAFAIGGVAGAAGAALGTYAVMGAAALGVGTASTASALSIGGYSLGTTGVISGAVSGTIGAAFSNPVKQLGNHLVFGDDMSVENFFQDVAMGAVFGGVAGGLSTIGKGQNLWWGNSVPNAPTGIQVPGYTATAPNGSSQSTSFSSRLTLEQNISFGDNANQLHHTFRHTDAMGISQDALKKAITNNLRANASAVQNGTKFWNVIKVGGQRVEYHAFLRPNGTFNVGRINGTPFWDSFFK